MLNKPDFCKTCLGWQWGQNGYVPASGSGRNGVLVVLEAAGSDEAASGLPTVGRAGFFLWNNLKRVDLDREDFRIHNVLSCQPPGNKLAKASYEDEVIAHCSPLLDATIADMQERCKANGKHFTILTLGRIAFKKIMGLREKDPIMRADYLNYPFHSEKYDCFVLAGDHPSYLMRGNSHLIPVLQYGATRAVEIAEKGLTYHEPRYLRDPAPETFATWCNDYIRMDERNRTNLSSPIYLAFDIETPHKQGKDEEEVAREDDDDFTILRCSFAYRPGEAISVPWRAEYLPYLEQIFSSNGPKLAHNCPTPDQRLLTADLTWVAAGKLMVGDKLVSFDEDVPPAKKLRQFKVGVITNISKRIAEVYEVGLSDGTTVKTTADHLWLINSRKGAAHKERVYHWHATKNLKIGQSLRRMVPIWSSAIDYNSGWLAGFFDGEGSLSQHGFAVNVAQNEGPTLDRARRLIRDAGFDFYSYKNTSDNGLVRRLKIKGGATTAAAFLGQIRPTRLLTKFKPEMLGAAWAWEHKKLLIKSIKCIGNQEVMAITTTAHTYLLEGFGSHNCNYDVPRITAQMPINGPILDNMLAWHVLNSSLPKGLGFITPFYAKDMPMWKHLSDKDPAGYNCQDSDATLRDFLGIKKDLEKNGLKNVFERHIVKLNEVLSYMSSKGVLRDEVMRKEAEERLSKLLDEVETKMKAVVPQEARRLSPKNGYKKAPASLDGLVQATFRTVVKRCDRCGCTSPTKTHFKARKRSVNPCEGATSIETVEEVIRWGKPLEFKVSKVGLTNYQRVLRHLAIVDHRENKTTFDETAIKQLIKRYPKDELYPAILQHREYQKLYTTYIGVTQPNGHIKGGMNIGRDGRIHCQYTHNPSTLRLACQSPNMTNLPRAKQQEDLQTIVRNLIVAAPEHMLVELDFSAIESVLVGFFAGSADYIRLSKLGIHSYLASHVLGRPADLKWSDADLRDYFKEIKKSKDQAVQDIYNASKRVSHLSGYGGTPKKMHIAEPEAFPTVKDAERLQGIYFDLCPYIKKWHLQTQLQADKDGFLRNPFSYIHRFNRVFAYKKENGKWVRTPGDEANKVLAFLPQSTAAAIIKETMLRLYYERFEEAGKYLRLQVHDSLVAEVPMGQKENIERVMKEEMTKPIPELRLPKSYGLGDYLTIEVECKSGLRWGSMN